MNLPIGLAWRARARRYLAAHFLGRRLLFSVVALALLVHAMPPRAAAQAAGNGSVAGRVQNAANGASLNNARVAVKGTNQVTFTDEAGTYRLDGLPSGPVTLRVFFTGLDEQEATVNVAAGEVARRDFELTSAAHYGKRNDTVQLDAFTVQSTRETNAAAIAVNEQRFASNIKSVVSTDEFGTIVDKNPGEFLKWLPGVDVEYFANNIVGVSVRGLGSVNTEINFDGMPTASANAEAVGRSYEVQYASSSDIARVEIRKLPLPEDSSNALGGSINLIRRSAFEYSRRQISYSALLTSDGEELTLDRMDGPKDKLRSRWRPNWEVKWTEPLTKDFGFAISLGQNNVISNTHWSLPGWNLGSAANNTAAAAALAAGRSYTQPSIYTPAVTNSLNHNAPLMQGKDYASLRVDWRPRSELTLSYSLSGTRGWKEVADDIRYRWNAAQTGSGDAASYTDRFRTVGRTGGGGIYHDNPLWRDIDTPTVTNTFEARWRKGVWSARAAGVASFSKYTYKDIENGFFNSTSVGDVGGLTAIGHTGVGAGTPNPVPLTITFDDQTYWGPKTITAAASANYTAAGNNYTAGQPVEWWKNSVARIGGARSRPGTGKAIVTAAKVHVKRDFALENPLSLQLGFDVAEEFKSRRYPYDTWRFVGADGVYGSADDAATLIAAEHLPARPDSAYNYPAIERISLSKLHDLYRAHPTWFQYDAARSARLSLTSNPDYELTETTWAPYLQFDWQLMRNRLRLTGGVRYEKNEAQARGLSINNSAAYQTYADGSVRRANDVLGPNGLPTTRAGAPVFLPGVANGSLEHTALVYKAKGAYAEGGNDNFFPSLHVNYNVTEKLVWQAGYAKTQAKNRFDRSVIPHNEIVENTASATTALGRINVRNKDLKPWTADNVETRLSYYTELGGVFGVGLFRKNIQDYQLNLVGDPLTPAEATELAARFPDLGIGAEHAGYELATWRNVGSARIDGAEFEMRQSLDPLLRRVHPEWGRGFMVRGTAAYTNLKGQPAGGDFNQLRDKRYTFSLGYYRSRFSGNIGYIMNGRQVNNGLITSNGFTAEQVHLPDHMVDFNLTFSLTKWAQLFVAGSNITDERRKREDQYKERPDWSRMVQSNTYGITYTVGVTGRF